MKIGKLLGVVFTIVMLVGLLGAGCAKKEAAPAPAPEGKVFELVFGNIHAFDNPDNILYRASATALSKESGGRIHIAVVPASLIAAPTDLYDAARSGICDIADQNLGFITGRFPLHEIVTMPFLFDDPDAWRAGLTSWELHQKYPELQAEYAETKNIGFWYVGRSAYNTTKKPIHTLEDLKGQIMIMYGVGLKAGELLGAVPSAIAFPEWYDALAKGVADGLDSNVLGHIVNTKTHELCNYTTVMSMSGSGWAQVMNLDTWNSLPPDLQKILADNFYRTSRAHGYEWDRACKKYEEWLDGYLKAKGYEGVYILPEAERARWAELTKPVWEDWVKNVAPSIGEDRARAILADAQKIGKQMDMTEADIKESQATFSEFGYVAPEMVR